MYIVQINNNYHRTDESTESTVHKPWLFENLRFRLWDLFFVWVMVWICKKRTRSNGWQSTGDRLSEQCMRVWECEVGQLRSLETYYMVNNSIRYIFNKQKSPSYRESSSVNRASILPDRLRFDPHSRCSTDYPIKFDNLAVPLLRAAMAIVFL